MLAARLSTQPLRNSTSSAFQHQPLLSRPGRWMHNQPQKPTEATKEGQKHNNPGELPKFSFKDLGATPAVKAVVYITVGIIGTAETVTYGQWAYHKWWKPAVDESSDE